MVEHNVQQLDPGIIFATGKYQAVGDNNVA
jgi:hypothetical protein